MNKDHDDFLDSFGSDRPASGHDKAPTDGASDTPPDGIDNLADDVRPWSATGYAFFKRQAQDDPNVWLSLGGATGAAPIEAASR